MKGKTFIEFCDNIFALEDVILIEKCYSWNWKDDKQVEKVWRSAIYLGGPKCYFSFPQERYDEIKQIMLNFKKGSYDEKN